MSDLNPIEIRFAAYISIYLYRYNKMRTRVELGNLRVNFVGRMLFLSLSLSCWEILEGRQSRRFRMGGESPGVPRGGSEAFFLLQDPSVSPINFRVLFFLFLRVSSSLFFCLASRFTPPLCGIQPPPRWTEIAP